MDEYIAVVKLAFENPKRSEESSIGNYGSSYGYGYLPIGLIVASRVNRRIGEQGLKFLLEK